MKKNKMIEIEKNTFHIKCHSSSSTSYVRRISSGNHQAIFYKSLRNFTNITEKTYRAEDFSHRPPPNTFKHRDHKLDFRTIWEKDLFKHALVYVWKSKLAILQNYYRNTINAKPSWDLAWFWKKKQDQYQSSQKRIQTKIWCSRWIRIKPIKSVLVKKTDTNKKLKTKKKQTKKYWNQWGWGCYVPYEKLYARPVKPKFSKPEGSGILWLNDLEIIV